MPSPIAPARMLFWSESCPSVGPTVRLWITSRGTAKAPALSWMTRSSTSVGGTPSMIPCVEMAPLIVGDEMTCLSMTIDIGWPR